MLEYIPIELSAGSVAAPALAGDLAGGYVYEIIQPKNPETYMLSGETFYDMIMDEAEVDVRNLAALLNLEEYLE